MNDYYRPVPLDLGFIWRIAKSAIASHWKRILGMVLASAVLAYVGTMFLQPQYRAVATLHVESKGSGVFDMRQLLLNRRDPAFQATQVGVIESRVLLEKVVRELELHKAEEQGTSNRSMLSGLIDMVVRRDGSQSLREDDMISRTVESVKDSLEVSPRASSYLIDIRVSRDDPAEAALIANSLAGAYRDKVRNQGREESASSQRWLLERIQEVRLQLQVAETELQQYKEEQNIVGDSRRSQGQLAQQLEAVSSKFQQARQERLALETLYRQIRSTEAGGGELLGIAAVQSNQMVQSIQSEILKLEKRISELSRRYGPEHRRMIELKSELAATRASLKEQTQHVVSTIKAEYELAKETESFLENSISQSTSNVQDLSRKQFRLINLEQNVATQRDIYEAFLKQLNQGEAKGDDATIEVKIVDPAKPPRRPMSSKAPVIVLGAIVLGGMLAFVLAVVSESYDASIYTGKDVESKLGQQAIVQVPYVFEENGEELGPNGVYNYYAIHPFSGYAEAIRSLRSSLILSTMGRRKTRVLVTSTVPGEGKTSVAIGLASSFGQMHRTLLIDGDLRRPSIQNLLPGTEDGKRYLGLSDLCIGSAGMDQCIHREESLGVDILPAGTVTPNPQELFWSTEFSETLNKLSEVYDHILFDSPPSGALSDAHLLSTHVDQVIYVVNSGETPIQRIRASLRRLTEANAPLCGVVLNQMEGHDDPYGYQYYREYGAENLKKVGSA